MTAKKLMMGFIVLLLPLAVIVMNACEEGPGTPTSSAPRPQPSSPGPSKPSPEPTPLTASSKCDTDIAIRLVDRGSGIHGVIKDSTLHMAGSTAPAECISSPRAANVVSTDRAFSRVASQHGGASRVTYTLIVVYYPAGNSLYIIRAQPDGSICIVNLQDTCIAEVTTLPPNFSIDELRPDVPPLPGGSPPVPDVAGYYSGTLEGSLVSTRGPEDTSGTVAVTVEQNGPELFITLHGAVLTGTGHIDADGRFVVTKVTVPTGIINLSRSDVSAHFSNDRVRVRGTLYLSEIYEALNDVAPPSTSSANIIRSVTFSGSLTRGRPNVGVPDDPEVRPPSTRTASASSAGSYAGYVASPHKAIDGYGNTFWCATSVPAWFMVDFGEVASVRNLNVNFYYHTVRGSLEVSTNGSSWTRVSSFDTTASDTGSGNDDSESKTFGVNRSIRYARINFSQTDAPSSHIYQACIYEVSIQDASGGVGGAPVAPPAGQPGQPSGQGATTASASSSGSYAGYSATPDQAVDGRSNTFWCATSVPAWFRVDLGESRSVRSLSVNFYYHTVQGTVEVSTDGSSWTRVSSFDTSASDTGSGIDDSESKTFSVNRSIRYARINFSRTDAPSGHIYKACTSEVSIQDASGGGGGAPSPPPTEQPGQPSGQATTTASASSSGSYAGYSATPDQAVDGRSNTFWCATSVPAWFRVDLGESRSVRSLSVNFYYHTVQGTVEVSTDGSSWTRVSSFDTSASDTGSGIDDSESKTFSVNRSIRYARINFSQTDAPSGHIYKACISEVSAS